MLKAEQEQVGGESRSMTLFSRLDARKPRQVLPLAQRLLAISALALLANEAHSQEILKAGEPLLIMTSDGQVVGLLGEHGQSFRGIPYAAPPTGSLRFRLAQAPRKWTRPHDARVNGAACQQILDPDGAERRALDNIPSRQFEHADATRFADLPK
jgi:hypothetical protein